VSTVLPGERGDGKIQGWHRDRLAVIYVRQSSRQQVADHGESTRLQYGLTGRAAALGWPESRVMVIDEDLGRSAANAAERPGFARLVAEITMGHVGLVLGLEMSRLARAGRDWHQLIELCSLAGALLADADGVYDPNWYNDRLLLGLKGTMSEVLCRYPDKASLGYPFNRSRAAVAASLLPATGGSRLAAPGWADDLGCLAARAVPWISGGRSGRVSGPGHDRRRVPAAGRTPGRGWPTGGG
jgi:hypothetical protein